MQHPPDAQFFFFAAICAISSAGCFFLPETRGRSLEDMDIIFGTITQEQRDEDIAQRVVRHEKAEMIKEEEKGEERRTESV